MGDQLAGILLDRVLGRGSSGEVWLAWSVGRQEPVAVKRRRAAVGADLRIEAARLRAISHPALVPVVDVIEDPPDVALVMPYLAGGSLGSLLAERGTLSPGEVVALLHPVASACAALHGVGLAHGDLKPDNVLLTAAGAPVLVDLGCAVSLGSRRGADHATTAAYLDPAVAGGAPWAPTADVFALAVIAYQSLSGRLPHRGEPALVVAAAGAGAHRSLRSWPAVPDAVADVVERGLDPSPDRRPADPVAFAAALLRVVDGREVVLPGPVDVPGGPVAAARGRATTTLRFSLAPPAPAPTRRAGPRRALVAVLALLALSALGPILLGLGPGRARTGPDAARLGGGPAARAAGGGRGRCPLVLPPPGSGALVAGDLDGDGCPDHARWDGATLVTATARGGRAYRVGEPGDQLVLGDWDGDGLDTPALYRPRTGEVRYVDRLPAGVGDRVGPGRVERAEPGGRATVAPAPAGRPGRRDTVSVARP